MRMSLWAVLMVPALAVAQPALRCGDADFAQRAVDRINAARQAGAQCGAAAQAPAGPISWSAALADASAVHAQDLALRNELAHAGRDGSQGSDRLRRAGYAWRRWAENLGAGRRASLDDMLRQWLASPGHCANLMQAELLHAGLACVVNADQRVYWVLELAAPRGPAREP